MAGHLFKSFAISIVMSVVLLLLNMNRINFWGGAVIVVLVFAFVFIGRMLAESGLRR